MATENKLTVARIVNTGTVPNVLELPQFCDPLVHYATASMLKACDEIAEPVSILQSYGGFIRIFQNLSDYDSGEASTEASIFEIIKNAKTTLETFLEAQLRKALRDKCQYLTLGFDVHDLDSPKHVELVLTYDSQQERFIAYTGKSYPVAQQSDSLIYCTNLGSHFQTLSNVPVLVLGCHDLNIYSPRSRKNAGPDTYKGRVIREMQILTDRFQPKVVLSHPHYTDTSKIWSLGIAGVRKFIPSAQSFSVGLNFDSGTDEGVREPLSKVLEETSSDDVIDLFPPPFRHLDLQARWHFEREMQKETGVPFFPADIYEEVIFSEQIDAIKNGDIDWDDVKNTFMVYAEDTEGDEGRTEDLYDLCGMTLEEMRSASPCMEQLVTPYLRWLSRYVGDDLESHSEHEFFLRKGALWRGCFPIQYVDTSEVKILNIDPEYSSQGVTLSDVQKTAEETAVMLDSTNGEFFVEMAVEDEFHIIPVEVEFID